MAALPRSRKLLCSGREEASRLKEAQVRHRFVVTTLVSPTPGETKKWGSLSLCQLRKRWASPPKDVSTGSPRSQGNDYAEWRSRSERLSGVGTAALGCPAPRSGGFGSRGVVAQAFSPGSPWVAGKNRSSARPKAERQALSQRRSVQQRSCRST